MKKHYLTNVSVQSTSDMGWHRWLWGVLMMAVLALPLSAQAQQNISGTVKDAKGEGLPGASVVIKGTTRGTSTDVDGKYQISATAGEILVATLTGYKPKEMTVGAEAVVDFSLEEDGLLEEVVVVGYTSSDRKDVTGSVSSIGSKDFNGGPITNPLQQISGRAAGVNITQAGSEPGATPTVRIRGITSLSGGNDPLVVVDGIQGNMDLLKQIPPSEIETFDILKDASATAVYGSRGAAGVILITTKKGKAGKTTMEYNAVVSFETIARSYEMLSADQWRAETQKRGLLVSSGAGRNDFGANTDWEDQLTRTGITQNHNLAFGGGTSNFNYRASFTAILQDGLVINSKNQNYTARIQATQRALNNKLGLTYNVNVTNTTNNFNGPGSYQRIFGFRPTDPVFNTDGSYFVPGDKFGGASTNPYAFAKEIIDGDKTDNMFGSVRADYDIIEGLTASVFGSWRRINRNYGRFEGTATTSPEGLAIPLATRPNERGVATQEANYTDERLFNFILNYKKSFGNHNLETTFVNEWQKQTYSGFRQLGRGFADPNAYNNILLANTLLPREQSSYKNDRVLSSFLLRANYSFMGKYMATVSVRRDASSVFGANYKTAVFPSASLAWAIKEEGFLKDNNFVSDLKLRVGYGVTGNQQGISPQQSLLLVEPDGAGGYTVARNANPDLRWETRRMFNTGLDFGLMDGKLTGSLDFYTGNTEDLLFSGYNVPTPPFPIPTITANAGKLFNQGLEIALNYKLIDTKDLQVNLAGNFTTNRTRVVELAGKVLNIEVGRDSVAWGGFEVAPGTGVNSAYLIKGQPIGTFLVHQHAGTDDAGNQLIVDRNGDGIIDGGDLSKDRYVAGQALPKFTYAFTPSIIYKRLSANFVFRGSHGNKIYNARRLQLSSLTNIGQVNVLADAPELNFLKATYPSDLWLENGGFFRLDNLTLGYDLGNFNSKYLQNARLSFTVNNVFIITQYKGIDPELSMGGGGGTGIDNGIYPRTRNFAIGLNINLK
ncbi:MAG: SusC/RagA family TonB-linked outer membrane protein [Bacteroidetes bacterium]|nr:MAG: SusC/RagA family TonB-linked outer membrane protein [Bacteroidota bacterium]